MKIRYFGHSAFHIDFSGTQLVLDPFISPNELASHIDIDEIKADYILLSHGHQDHIVDVERIAKNNNAKLVSNFELVTYYGQMGIDGHPMNHGGQWHFDFATVKYVNAVHSSSLPDGSFAGNPGGFVVSNANQCFYFAGDTALTMDMKLIPMTSPKLDVAILPIGDNFTMGIQDAVIAAEFIECDHIVACHYDTFGFIKIDHAAATAAFADKGKKLSIIPIGKSLEI